MTEGILSERPEGDPSFGQGEWLPSDRVCVCGSLMWQAPWWDDDLENGGACIGDKWECGDCGETDSS